MSACIYLDVLNAGLVKQSRVYIISGLRKELLWLAAIGQYLHNLKSVNEQSECATVVVINKL